MTATKTKIAAPSKEAVAREFSRILRTWLTAAQMKKIIKLNKTTEFGNENDFCDANMAMDEAFKNVAPAYHKAAWADNRRSGGEGKVWGEFMELFDAAWAVAKKSDHNASPLSLNEHIAANTAASFEKA